MSDGNTLPPLSADEDALRGIDPQLIEAANKRRVLIAPANVEPAYPQTSREEPKPSENGSNIVHYIMEGAMCVPVVGNVLALKDVAYDTFELCQTDAQGTFSNLTNVWLWATLTIDGIGVIPAAGNASAPVRAIIRHGLWEFARGAGLALLIDKLLSVFHGNIEAFLLKLESWIEQLKGLLVTYTQKLGNSLADFIHSPYAWAEQMKLIEKNWTVWPSDNGKKLVFRGMENLLGCMDPKTRGGLEKGMRLYSKEAAQQVGAAILKVLPVVMAIGNAVRERRTHTKGVQKGAQIANDGKAAQAVKHQQGAGECTRTKGNNSPVAPSYSAPCPVQHLAPKATTKNPIHLVMGDENLWQTDFVVPGIVDLEWTRFYRSSCDRLDDSELGARWSTPYHIRFELSENALYFIDEDNRMVPLAPLAVGETRFEPVEKLTLTRPSDNEIVCTTLDNQVQRFVAMAVRPVPADAVTPPLTRAATSTDDVSHTATPESTPTQIFRLVEQREQDGRSLQFAYAQGRLTQITDGAAMDVRLSYGEQGLVTQIDRHFPDSEHLPEVLARYTHDAHRDLITHTDPRERERSYRYEQHLLTFYSNRNGLGCHLEWQWPGQADGQPADAQNARCTRNWLDDGSEDTHFEYNRGLWYTKVTDAQNLITYYRYNEHNRLESRMHPYQPSLGSEHWRWDEQGNLIAHFDGEGRTTAMEYDAQGRLIKVTDPMSRTIAYEYDDQGRLTKTTDPVGRVEETRYDGQGRVVEEIDHAGRATKIAYDDLGQPIAVTDPAENTYQYIWNAQGQLTMATDCSGQVTQFVHDHRGQLIQQIDALGHRVQFQRDPMGLPVVIRYPDETREQFAYDGEGDLIRHTDAEGHETRYAYDGKGLPVERIDAAGFRLAYRYDSLRRLTALTNQNGEAWTFDFDGAGRVTREVGFDGRTRTYEYDEGGLLRTRREDDVTTHFKHDDLGLLKQLRTERPAFEPVETNYAHDMLGRLTAVTNRTADVRLHYDNGDNLIAEEQTSRLPNREQHRAVYRHSYDILGNRLTTQLPNGQEVAWLRYGSGHVHAMALDGAKLFDFGRDALHREIARHTDTQSQTRQYDTMGRLTRQQRMQGKDTVQQRLYHYTKASELGSIDDSLKGQTRYAYDPLGRLKRATSPLNDERFAFDPAGNLLDPEWLEQQARKDKADPKASRDSQPLNTRWDVTSDEVAFDYAHLPKVMGNLLQQYAGTHYQHDVRGNRIRETAPSGHTTEYTYDAEDRLIAAKRYRRAPAAGDNAPPEMQAKYGYDGFGRRLYKLVKQAKRPAHLTVFTWDGDLLTSEETFEGEYSFLERWAYPEAPALERDVPDEQYSLPVAQRVHSIVTQPRQRTHWLYEPESFIPAAQLAETYAHNVQRRTGTDAASLTTAGATTSEPRLYLIHTDHLGTPQELTDSDGTLQWAGQYRAWGELQKATDGQSNAASIDMRLRFQGQYCDEETGLHYNRFRYYDPRVGRFTTQDPISLAGGINLYQYAPNPAGWVDIFGLYNGEGVRELGKYHVFHEHSLNRSEYKIKDSEQFSLANKSVHQRLQTDHEFRKTMHSKYPDAVKDVQPSASGRFKGKSPTGLTWHHGDEPGSLQLVDRKDHREYHKIYHPDGTGGRNKWGGGTDCRGTKRRRII